MKSLTSFRELAKFADIKMDVSSHVETVVQLVNIGVKPDYMRVTGGILKTKMRCEVIVYGYSPNNYRTKRKHRDDIEQILMHYIGEYYEIVETAEKVYIGSDFPDEFTHSKYTKAIRGANEKAKANVITAIGELIQISDKKAEFPDYGNRHGNKAKNGWYRYDTRFGIPVYSEVGEIERYNIFRARMLVRCDANGKLFLYDIVQIKKETSTPLE